MRSSALAFAVCVPLSPAVAQQAAAGDPLAGLEGAHRAALQGARAARDDAAHAAARKALDALVERCAQEQRRCARSRVQGGDEGDREAEARQDALSRELERQRDLCCLFQAEALATRAEVAGDDQARRADLRAAAQTWRELCEGGADFVGTSNDYLRSFGYLGWIEARLELGEELQRLRAEAASRR